jgi:isopentenyldiphosphate isomerase
MVDEPCFTLSLAPESEITKIKLDGPLAQDVDESLIAILSRVMVQWAVEKQSPSPKLMAIQLPNEELISNISLLDDDGIKELFKPLIDSIENVELSEMVDQNGKSLGMVPRKLVHKVNLLHRGVGMVVTKDQPILVPGCTNFPDLYMHRRTDTKRIFPSLYDMFVGGVSTAREESKMTAAREVAEELGLHRALTDPTTLSDPLFECIVCTAYNRCVVTVFCCTFNSAKDSVQWQDEEVAWETLCHMPQSSLRQIFLSRD